MSEGSNSEKITVFGPKEIKTTFFVSLYTLIISTFTGIFLFDNNLILYKKITQNKISIYTNYHDLLPLLRNILFSLIWISLALVILSIILKKRKNLGYLECAKKQLITFMPLLFLVFGRFLYGKAIKAIFFVPLFPLFIVTILAAVIYLNLILHYDFNLFHYGSLYLQKKYNKHKKIFKLVPILLMTLLLIHILASKSQFKRFTGAKLFSGDEPKYLRMTNSLATDGDLDVSDEFIIPEGIEKAKEEVLSSGSRKFGSLSIIGNNGKIYHVHMPGLSILMLPGFLLDTNIYPQIPEDSRNLKFLPSKLKYTRLWLLIIGISAFLLLARLIFQFFNSLILVALLLLLFIFSSPAPNFIFQLYPEIAASFFVLLVLNALLFPFKKNWINYLFIILGIGYLPWLHQRFIFLSLGLYFVLIINELFFRKKFGKALIITIFLFITSLPYFYYFYSITGNPLPNSINQLYGSTFTRISMFPLGFFGHLFDQSVGMIWLYPWTVLALIGIYRGLKLDRRKTITLLIIFIPYYMLTCSHIAWHGMVKEPGRYLIAIFPLLLIFLAYTIRAFFRKPTYFYLFLYSALLTIAFINNKINFLVFSFKGSYVTYSHFIQIIICVFLLILLYLSIHLSDKFTKKRLNLIPLNEIWNYLKTLNSKRKSSYFLKRMGKSIVPLLFIMLIVYLLVFIKTRDGESRSLSYLGSLNKMSSLPDLQLSPKKNPADVVEKSNKKFIDLLRNVHNFHIDSEQKMEHIIIGNTDFYEKIPRGYYEIKLETEYSIPENTCIRLNFMRKARLLRFKKISGKTVAITRFLLFKDMFISPDIKLRLEASKLKTITGKLEIHPIPCVVYGKELILTLFPKHNPKSIRKKGKNRYNLSFFMKSNEAKRKYKFLLYTIKAQSEDNIEQELLLASTDERSIEKKGPHKVNIVFRVPFDFNERKSGFVLSVYDEDNRAMKCKSLLLKTKRNYWICQEAK